MSKATAAQPMRHVCCFYASEQERVGHLTRCLRKVLDEGERLIYLADRLGFPHVLGQLESGDIDAAELVAAGRLEVHLASAFASSLAPLDPHRVVSLLRARIRAARSEGFDRQCVAFEATWLASCPPELGGLLEHEARLDEVVSRGSAALLCLYDTRKLCREGMLDALVAHGGLLLDGRPISNPLYLGGRILEDHLSTGVWVRNLSDLVECRSQLRSLLDSLGASPGESDSLSSLTPREREVLALLADGVGTRRIAYRLGISPKTVETHRRHVIEKTGIDSVAGLTKLAVRAGLVSLGR